MTKTQKILTVPVLGAIMLAGGAVAGYAGLAFAQSTDTATGTATAQNATMKDHPRGPHAANGKTEEVLTGETAAKVTAAAQAAQPGATIDRVETDADGAVYEAHMTKADGSRVTVLFDANYAVTATEDGPEGHGGR